MRQHLAPEQVDVPLAQFSRHRAEMQKRQEMADTEALHVLNKLLAHGLGTTHHDESAFVQIFGLELAKLDFGAGMWPRRLHQRRIFETTWNLLIVLRRIQQLIEEIFGDRK